MKNEVKYERDVKEKMQALGIYKPEFNDAIKIYVHAKLQYDTAWKEFVDGGCKSSVACAGGVKKNPVLINLEETRKQLSVWQDKLGLNPKALDGIKSIETVKAQTGLESCLGEITNALKGFSDS